MIIIIIKRLVSFIPLPCVCMYYMVCNAKCKEKEEMRKRIASMSLCVPCKSALLCFTRLFAKEKRKKSSLLPSSCRRVGIFI